MTYPDLAHLGRLDLTGIEVWAYHGVYADERRDGQPYIVDLTWWLDLDTPAGTDDLTTTVDYAQVAMFVVKHLQAEPVNLIETLAVRLRDAVLSHFAMPALQVTIHKPAAPVGVPFADVRVTTPVAYASSSCHPGAGRDPRRVSWGPVHGTGAGDPDFRQDGVSPTPCHPGPEAQDLRRDPPYGIPDARGPSRTVVYSLGSNVEPRWEHLQFAVGALAATPGLGDVRVSPVYDTAPQGVTGHPDYLNAVVVATSTLPAPVLLDLGLRLERLAGRTPDPDHPPRTLDVDLIAVGDEHWDTAGLTLPHPRAAHRAFVLVPWLDLDPAAALDGVRVADLVRDLTPQPLTRLAAELVAVRSNPLAV